MTVTLHWWALPIILVIAGVVLLAMGDRNNHGFIRTFGALDVFGFACIVGAVISLITGLIR